MKNIERDYQANQTGSGNPLGLFINISPWTESGIDFLRGGFAILVLLAHSIEAAREGGPVGALGSPWYGLLAPGGFWVGGFFVLSGFCIGISVLRSLGKGDFSIKKYIFQRLTRILPIYYCALSVVVLAWWSNSGVGFPMGRFMATVGGLQNFFFDSLLPYFSASWSITNELFYYAILPLLIWLGGKSGRMIFYAGLGVYVGMTLLAAGAWLALKRPDFLIPFWTIPWNGVAWMVGFGGVCWGKNVINARVFCKNSSILSAAIIILFLAFSYRTWALWSNARAFVTLVAAPVTSIGFMLLILSLDRIPRLASPRISAVGKRFGLLSYPLYLFHQPLQGCIGAAVDFMGVSIRPEGKLIIYFVGSLVLCGIFGVWLEQCFLAWRSRWLKRKFSS